MSYIHVCFKAPRPWLWPPSSNKAQTLNINPLRLLYCLWTTKNTTAQGLFIVFNHVEMKSRGGWLLVVRVVSIISHRERRCPFLLPGYDRNKWGFYRLAAKQRAIAGKSLRAPSSQIFQYDRETERERTDWTDCLWLWGFTHNATLLFWTFLECFLSFSL